MLVDNRAFGRLEGTRRTEAQQAKPKCDCVVQLAQKRRILSITVARRLRSIGELRAERENRRKTENPNDQKPLRDPRDVMARANSPPAVMARRPAASSGW